MTTEHTNGGWKFWLQWVIASTAGFAVILIASGLVFIVTGFWSFWPESYYSSPQAMIALPLVINIAGGVMIGPVAGGLAGVLQWLVLQQRVSRAGGWAIASAIGLIVGQIVSSICMIAVVPPLHGEPMIAVPNEMRAPLLGAVIGAVVGGMQWASLWLQFSRELLQRQVSWAGWWLLANTLGGAAVVAVSVVPLQIVTQSGGSYLAQGLTLGLGMVVGGAVYGALTGATLIWRFRRPARRWSLLVDLIGAGLGLMALAMIGLFVLVAVIAVGGVLLAP